MRAILLVMSGVVAALWSTSAGFAGPKQDKAKTPTYEMSEVETAAGKLKLIHIPDPTPSDLSAARQNFTIAKFSWWKDGFGSVLLADFTIENKSAFDIKDAKIGCVDYAPSGTILGANNRTIFQIFPANSKRTITRFNMGFINSQTKSLGCEIADFAIIPGTQHPKVAAPAKK